MIAIDIIQMRNAVPLTSHQLSGFPYPQPRAATAKAAQRAHIPSAQFIAKEHARSFVREIFCPEAKALAHPHGLVAPRSFSKICYRPTTYMYRHVSRYGRDYRVYRTMFITVQYIWSRYATA